MVLLDESVLAGDLVDFGLADPLFAVRGGGEFGVPLDVGGVPEDQLEFVVGLVLAVLAVAPRIVVVALDRVDEGSGVEVAEAAADQVSALWCRPGSGMESGVGAPDFVDFGAWSSFNSTRRFF